MQIMTKKRLSIVGADQYAGKGNRGDDELMQEQGIKKRNKERQMVVNFVKRMKFANLHIYFVTKE